MKTVNIIAFVYVGLAALQTVCLMLAGMSFFDAVNHSFSTVATGGFSTRGESIAYYDSAAINIIIIVFMTLASIHFGLIFGIVVTRSFTPFTTPVVKFYLGTLAVLSVMVTLSLKFSGTVEQWGQAAMDATFQVTSFLTTTGFGTADNVQWPVFANVLLLYAAFQCGCSGSTTGGVKSDRVLITVRAIGQQIRKRLHPSSISQVRVGNHLLREDAVMPAILYIVLYIFVLLISFLLVLLCGVEVSEAFSGVLASIGNVGPGLDSIGTMGNYSAQPLVAKLIYSLDMFLGRVEIYPAIVVFSLLFRRDK